MRWYLERMMQILQEPQPGGFLIGQHIGETMLVEALRLYLADGVSGGAGWLFALADRQMNAAITAMHAHPGHHWTLQTLAERAGMSRSTFAVRFKEKVGTPAIEYLSRWRMLRAGDLLLNSDDSISTISLALGYESESAFGYAFKREMGCSPRQYCRARTPASAKQSEARSPVDFIP